MTESLEYEYEHHNTTNQPYYPSEDEEEILIENSPENDEEDDNHLYHTHLSLSSLDDNIESRILTPKCPICLSQFNRRNRKSKVIVDCGHTVCKSCLDNIDLCPICRIEITDTVINWAIHSEIKKKEKIKPFYKIFIDLKDEIENLYLSYPDQDIILLNEIQLLLLNKIKIRLRGLNINKDMIDELLIPKWLSRELKISIDKIENYQKKLGENNISDLELMLPFCP
jgi:hypothetical protein